MGALGVRFGFSDESRTYLGWTVLALVFASAMLGLLIRRNWGSRAPAMTLANPLSETTIAITTFRQLNVGAFDYLSRVAMAGHCPKRHLRNY